MTGLRTVGGLNIVQEMVDSVLSPNLYYTNKSADDDTNLQYTTANFLIRGGSSRGPRFKDP